MWCRISRDPNRDTTETLNTLAECYNEMGDDRRSEALYQISDRMVLEIESQEATLNERIYANSYLKPRPHMIKWEYEIRDVIGD